MRTTFVLLYKFITTFIAAWVAFQAVDQNTISMILLIALIGTILKFTLKDLFIFPTMGNIFASIIDGILAATTVYVVDIFANNFSTSTTGLIIFAAIIAVGEYFFHIYLIRNEKEESYEFHRDPPLE